MVEKDNAIGKALDILMAFTPSNDELSTFEISRILGYNQSTSSRILQTLSHRGFLQQDQNTKKFTLGRSSLDLWQAMVNSLMTPFVQMAKPYVDELRTKIRTTIVFEQLVNDKVLVVHVAEGPQWIKLAGEVGDQVLIHAAAGAKAILAFSKPSAVTRILERNSGFEPRTPNTITDRGDFIDHLKKTRHRGYAIDNAEIDSGVKAIGVPVFDAHRMPIAALIAAYPAYRLPGDCDPEMLAAIKRTAEAISVRWSDEIGATG